METHCSSELHKEVIDGIETIMHRGSEFQKKEVLRAIARELDRLPDDTFDDFWKEYVSVMSKQDETLDIPTEEEWEMIMKVADVMQDVSEQSQSIGSEFEEEEIPVGSSFVDHSESDLLRVGEVEDK